VRFARAGQIFNREAGEHAGGMELRTGNAYQHRGGIFVRSVISNNVNSNHQVTSKRGPDAPNIHHPRSVTTCPAPPWPLVR